MNGTHDTTPAGHVSEAPESDDEALFESDEEELDDDQPYPPVIQEAEVPFDSPVLHVAVPDLSSTPSLRSNTSVPALLSECITIALACANGSVKLCTIPMDPPSAATKRKGKLGVRVCELGHGKRTGTMPLGVSLAWTFASQAGSDEGMEDTGRRTRSRSRSQHWQTATATDYALLVASTSSQLSGRLDLFRIPILIDHGKELISSESVTAFGTQCLAANPTQLTFSPSSLPSPRHSQLLIADVRGSVRVVDTQASTDGRPSSRESPHSNATPDGISSILTLNATFDMPKDTSSDHPGLAQRKKILSARWVSGGRAIIALMEDGEWGVWDLDGVGPKTQGKSSRALSSFSVRGFIGDAPETSAGAKPTSKSQLAPMTPNTRRVRQDNLFSGPTTQMHPVGRGGISVVSTATSHGAIDDSIALWYGNDVYTIPSLTNLWQRSGSSGGRDTGSLYGPGLSRVDDLDLFGEMITCVNQLPQRQSTSTSALGTMNQRDLLVAAEHRSIILAPSRTAVTGGLFAKEARSPTLRQDQMLLDSGELDIGGVDRMLDTMTGIEQPGLTRVPKSKRVGFAPH